MTNKLLLQSLASFIGLFLVAVSVAQENRTADNPARTGQANQSAGGNAELWMKELVEATVDRNAKVALNRLAEFHLTADQVGSLILAAESEKSDAKRVVLWQAIRTSHDRKGREYLIESLTQHSTPEMQIQFVEELRNPTRFDLPILVALYNSRLPANSATNPNYSPDPNRIAKDNVPVRSDKNPDALTPKDIGLANRRPTPADAAKKPDDPAAAAIQTNSDPIDSVTTQQPVVQDFRANDSLDSLYDVAQKITELACETDWKTTLLESGELPFQYDENTPEELKAKRAAVHRKKAQDAALAQKELVHWLIRNGRQDEHRLAAFHRYIFNERNALGEKVFVDYGYEFVDSLTNPECKAKAVRHFYAWANPARFLNANEAEIVRLSAIEAMGHRILESRKSNPSIRFQTLMELQPLLKNVQETDPSPKVQAAAQRLRETIAGFQKE